MRAIRNLGRNLRGFLIAGLIVMLGAPADSRAQSACQQNPNSPACKAEQQREQQQREQQAEQERQQQEQQAQQQRQRVSPQPNTPEPRYTPPPQPPITPEPRNTPPTQPPITPEPRNTPPTRQPITTPPQPTYPIVQPSFPVTNNRGVGTITTSPPPRNYVPGQLPPGSRDGNNPAVGDVAPHKGVTIFTPHYGSGTTAQVPTATTSKNSAPAVAQSNGVTTFTVSRPAASTLYTVSGTSAAAATGGSSGPGYLPGPQPAGQPSQPTANGPWVVVGFAFAFGVDVSSDAYGACWSVQPGGYVANAPGGPNDSGNCSLALCRAKSGQFSCAVNEVRSNPEGTWASIARESAQNSLGDYAYGWAMDVTSDLAQNEALNMCNLMAENACVPKQTFQLTAGGMLSGGVSSPPEYVKPTFDNCIQHQFYDPSMYNWLAVENSCSQELLVEEVWQDGSGVPGTLDIPASGKSNTGYSQSDLAQHKGLEFYACPAEYAPVEPDGKTLVHSPVKGFICKFVG